LAVDESSRLVASFAIDIDSTGSMALRREDFFDLVLVASVVVGKV